MEQKGQNASTGRHRHLEHPVISLLDFPFVLLWHSCKSLLPFLISKIAKLQEKMIPQNKTKANKQTKKNILPRQFWLTIVYLVVGIIIYLIIK